MWRKNVWPTTTTTPSWHRFEIFVSRKIYSAYAKTAAQTNQIALGGQSIAARKRQFILVQYHFTFYDRQSFTHFFYTLL